MKGINMKSKMARALRKWADLIDPRVKPSDEITIHINVDARDAINKVEAVEQAVKRVLADAAAYSASAAQAAAQAASRRKPSFSHE